LNEVKVALTIVGMGLITYSIRVSFFLLPERITLPDRLLQALRYVPAAVLSAIIFPAMFLSDGLLDISLGNERLIAGLAAGLVAWRTRNLVITIVVGMGVLWILQLLADQQAF
jgi:branched-subunit amino acid transport protein